MAKKDTAYWARQLEIAYSDEKYKQWRKLSKDITRRYRNQAFISDKDMKANKLDETSKGYNLLYRNVSVRLPFILPFIPKVQVDRTNRDSDSVARCASQILERITNKIIDCPQFKRALSYAKLDAELTNFGIIWVSYAPFYTEGGLLREDITFDYVGHDDFIWQKSKHWDDCGWVARRIRMRDEDVKKQFPRLRFDGTLTDAELDEIEKQGLIDEKDRDDKTVSVYEIWDKWDRKVYIYHPTFKRMLAVYDYPYEIDFPCARPLSYDDFIDSTVPVPRHAQYLAQYEAIDRINAKLTAMKDTLRVVGAYDASVADFGKIFDADNENRMIGLKNTEKYQGKPLSDMIWLYDNSSVVASMESLKVTRDEYIADVQKGLGIYDVLEGETKATEAYGTNRLKGSFGTMRLQDDQKDAIYFVQDTIRIACDIICQTFEALSLLTYSTIEYSTETLDQIMQAIDLLKTESLKNTRLTISLEDVRSYYDADYKANISELWTNVFMQLDKVSAMVQTIPEMAIIAKPAIMSMIRGYKVGAFVEQEMEQAIDNAIAAYQERLSQPQQPTPEMVKAQNEQQKLALDAQRLQLESQKTGAELANTNAKDKTAMLLENKRADAEIAKIVSDTEINNARLEIMQQEADRKERELDAEIKLAMYSALHPDITIDTNLGSIGE
ncbi:MAG: hypothetical protein J6R99_02915 [Alphaproteobacteria bacterium]|nr:hypothetical protein [Alphaproteobacteria bacterium]MBO7066580.1 hypothetical protein [Alphaproteobacteria bacterium]